jgi:phospholipid N-methyltransferase
MGTEFLRQALRAFDTTGAISPSSSRLSRAVTKAVDLKRAKVVVELGSGTGAVTEKILRRISPETLFFALEINKSFVKSTKRRCPGTTVYHDSAASLRKYLDVHGVQGCDCVVSGLPWACFESKLQRQILRTVRDCLNPGGEFVMSSYIHGQVLPRGLRFRKNFRRIFPKFSTVKTVWRNLPPAFVFYARK